MLQGKEIKRKHASVGPPPKKRPSKALVATAYHEAGHALVAYMERIRIKRVTIKPGETYSGGIVTKPCVDSSVEYDNSRKQTVRVERAVRVLLAGAAAQRRFSPHGYRHFHGESDRHGAINLISYLTRTSEETAAYFKLLNIQAKNKIKVPWVWAAIQALAEALLSHETISGKRARAIIRRSIQNFVSRRSTQSFVSPAQSGGHV